MKRTIALLFMVIIVMNQKNAGAASSADNPPTQQVSDESTATAKEPSAPENAQSASEDGNKTKTEGAAPDQEAGASPKDSKAKTAAVSALAASGSGSSENKLLVSSHSLDVDPITGTATVSLPIEVPQGRGGIQPNLSLIYNSSSPSDLFGLGWLLELGGVQRATKKGPPKYTTADEFVLVQAGSQTELTDISGNGSEYRPKIEGGFNKVQFIGNTYWLVTDKKGTKYFFGQTDASRVYDVADPGRRFKYCLDRIEDIHGNYLTVTYLRDGNDLIPDTVNYTGHASTGILPFAKVKFEYQARPDLKRSHIAGFKQEITKRVSALEISAAGGRVRRYEFTYTQDAATNQTLLTRVKQLGSDGVTVLPETVFSYSLTKSEFNPAVNLDNYPGADLGASKLVYVTDVNGDGLADFIRSVPGQSFNYNIFINRSANGTISFNSPYVAVNSPDWGTDNADIRMADFNGDGFLDVIHGPAGNYRIWLNNGNNGYQPPVSLAYEPAVAISDQNLVQLVDMNQDGRADILETGTGGTYKIYFSNGNGNVGAPLTAVNSPVRGTNNPNVRFFDFNGDGLLDVLYAESCPYQLSINNGSNGFLPIRYLSSCPGEPISTQNLIQLVDMNGDGLTDLLKSTSGPNPTYSIYYNDGNDFSSPITAVNPPAAGLDNPNVKLIDMNNDGFSDILYGDASAQWTISFNNGYNGFMPLVRIYQHDPAISLDDPNHMLVDIDGDGRVDILYGLQDQFYKAWINQKDTLAAKGGILVKTDNSVGATTEIEYNASPVKNLVGNQYKIGFSPVLFNTVKAVTRKTVLGDSYKTSFSFKNGLWNHPNREFRGFGLARVTDPLGNYAETKFLQDDLLKGRPQEQASYNSAGQLFAKSMNTWSSQNINPSVNFVFLQKADQLVYDGNATGRRTQEEYIYSESPQLGNLTKVIQSGEVNLSTGADLGTDKRTVETSYSNNTAGGNYLVGFPQYTIARDFAGTQVRRSEFFYDGAAAFTTLPTKGLLTQKKDWGGSAAGAVHPVVKYSYDALGNLLTTTDARNNSATITYDSVFKLFPLKVRNALGQEVNNEYYGVNGVALNDGAGLTGLWGQLKSTTDPNGQKGQRAYDVLGRAKFSVSPLDTVGLPTTQTNFVYTSQYAKVTIKQRLNSSAAATIDAHQFYDGLGRLIQTKTPAEAPGTWVISGQTTYNSRGLPERQFLPYFSNSALDTLEAIDLTKPFVRFDYDAMGRPIKSTNADGTYASLAYDDWMITSVNENGHEQKSYSDAFGRLIKKEEYTGADGRSSRYPASAYALYATTAYSYDSEGNLLQTTDANGNVTTINYDALGRKTQMTDPDMGLWKYAYDAAGNLTGQTDAKNQLLSFTYDPLNRLTNKKDGATSRRRLECQLHLR